MNSAAAVTSLNRWITRNFRRPSNNSVSYDPGAGPPPRIPCRTLNSCMPTPPPCTVFVVDDDQGLLRLVKKSLTREGFAGATASSGREALARLSSHGADLL